MIDEDEIIEAVELDVTQGLKKYFSEGEFKELLPRLFVGFPRVITEADTSVIAWRYTGLNTEPINNVMPAIERRTQTTIADAPSQSEDPPPVNVEGVTIVHHPPGTNAAEWGYYRFIDWNSIAGQIGTSRGRAATPVPITEIRLAAGWSPRGLPSLDDA